jgi:hypothetical protein
VLQIINRVTKYVINLITKYVIKHVTIIKTKTCGLSVACVLDSVMSGRHVYLQCKNGEARQAAVLDYGTILPPTNYCYLNFRTVSPIQKVYF